ncbi:hypothetical protein C7M84_008400 [Penaeus vannamei]|uniref:Uncharacterized protein n=1 Tax=Penaeus vannamei TaxID=6689 RepID=A0A423T9V0_PENVA|nr:hypothetical protein C7M84_008400 [Penaeus vannamei]
MLHSGCETVNPHLRAHTRLWRTLGGMDDVMFPPVPDTALKGTHTHFPLPADSSSPESFLPRRNTSFLWDKTVQDNTDFESSFDPDAFFRQHRHLLAESDHSTELEKSLYDRRKGIAGTYSTLESKSPSGFTSAHDTHLYAGMTTPYDELTYEETLFEVKVDRLQPRAPSLRGAKAESSIPPTSEEEAALQVFLKNRQLKAQAEAAKHEPSKTKSEVEALKKAKEERNYSKRNTTSFGRRGPGLRPRRAPTAPAPSPAARASASAAAPTTTTASTPRRTPAWTTASRSRSSSRTSRSASRPWSARSGRSKEYILREIAAVLAAKGYLPGAQAAPGDGAPRPKDPSPSRREPPTEGASPRQPRHRAAGVQQLSRVQRYKSVSPRSTPPRARKAAVHSNASTYRSHKEPKREPAAQDSSLPKTSGSLASSGDAGDAKRRKRRSTGSRSSLTSLLRAPETSSSDTELDNSFRSRRPGGSGRKGGAVGVTARAASLEGGRGARHLRPAQHRRLQPSHPRRQGRGGLRRAPGFRPRLAPPAGPRRAPGEAAGGHLQRPFDRAGRGAATKSASPTRPADATKGDKTPPGASYLLATQGASLGGDSRAKQDGLPTHQAGLERIPSFQVRAEASPACPSRGESTPTYQTVSETATSPVMPEEDAPAPERGAREQAPPSEGTLASHAPAGSAQAAEATAGITDSGASATEAAKASPEQFDEGGASARPSRTLERRSSLASRPGSPQHQSPARQSLGQASATSQPHEDRSQADYFVMDHVTGNGGAGEGEATEEASL